MLAGGFAAGCGSSTNEGSAASSAPTSALPDNPATGSAVKIGFIATEGGAAVSIPELREAAEAATKYVNDNAGGITGHKIDLVVCKQQEDPTSARNCANQMVEQQVAAVLSPGTSQGPVMLPIISGAQIPFVGFNGVSPQELMSPDSSMLSPGLPGVLTSTAEYAAKNGWKNVTFIVGDTGGAPAVVQQLGDPIFTAAGVGMKSVPYPVGTADPTPQITAALANNPDAVGVISDASACISVLKTMQASHPDVKKILIPTCLEEQVIKAAGQASVDGGVGLTLIDPYSDKPDSELYRSVLAAYAPELSPSGLGSASYQLVVGLQRATNNIQGEVNAASIKEALKTSKNVEMPAGGGITFSCDGTAFPQLQSICSRQMLVGPVKDGIPTDLQVTGQTG
ncbi:hypothetical protein GORHZ_131_00080 [Gordonia rhizosphera NBRC 16068]|uniref:Leucine-binding protein domain-containing protein n=1 Tax=Gordonia rhizosphera NBRC 16068 TaxID=1108045 RepID=K6WCG1_9ACTN|nr:hypothetical protein GORHZ_131_00080 [Gordonia rhizosphera NBRC 16068]